MAVSAILGLASVAVTVNADDHADLPAETVSQQEISAPAAPQVAADVAAEVAAPQLPDPAGAAPCAFAPGSSPTVASGETCVIDSDVTVGDLTIDGTVFVADKDLTITASNIMVMGAFVVGTREAPITQQVQIVLTGTDRDADVMGMGTKSISSMAGATVSMVGSHGQQGWGLLAETVPAGATTVTTAPGFTVSAGDTIALAPSGYDANEVDTVEVTAVAGQQLTLASPTQFEHLCGAPETYGDKTYAPCAEVANMSRNIVVRPADGSFDDGFGTHMMFSGPTDIDGVEAQNCGQSDTLRRYCFHLHNLQDTYDATIRNSVCDKAFNRCLAIHRTDGALIEGNVSDDNVGHSIKLEDGSERNNVLRNNLVMRTRLGTLTEEEREENRTAAMWITNIDNEVTGNHLAGGAAMGMWVDLREQGPIAVGPDAKPTISADDDVDRWNGEQRAISGNVAHSYGEMQGFIECCGSGFGVDKADSAPDEYGSVVLSDNVSYKNATGVWAAGAVSMVRTTMADTGIARTVNDAFFQDSLIIGRSAGNDDEIPTFNGTIIGHLNYDGAMISSGDTCANYGEAATGSPGGCEGLFQGHAPHIPWHYGIDSVEGMELINAQPVFLQTGDSNFGDQPDPGARDNKVTSDTVVVDSPDGSLTGTDGPSYITYSVQESRPGCTKNDEWRALICPGSSRPTTYGPYTNSDNQGDFAPAIQPSEYRLSEADIPQPTAGSAPAAPVVPAPATPGTPPVSTPPVGTPPAEEPSTPVATTPVVEPGSPVPPISGRPATPADPGGTPTAPAASGIPGIIQAALANGGTITAADGTVYTVSLVVDGVTVSLANAWTGGFRPGSTFSINVTSSPPGSGG